MIKSYNLPEKLIQKIEQEAANTDRSYSHMLKRIIEYYFKHFNKDAN